MEKAATETQVTFLTYVITTVITAVPKMLVSSAASDQTETPMIFQTPAI